MKLVLAAVAITVLVAGCGSAQPGGTVDLPSAEVAEISARAVEIACERYCGDSQVYVLAKIVDTSTQSGNEVMPVDMQLAVTAHVDKTEVISQERHDGMVAEGLPADPPSVIVYVGPLTALGDDLVGIDIGVTTRADGYRADTYLFRNTGNGWEPTSPEESGVTVTTSVS